MNSKKIFKCVLPGLLLLSVNSVTLGQVQATTKQKINFTDFRIRPVQNKISIDWATDNKVITNYFEIERSVDGLNFKTIAMILGPDPKQSNCDCYGYFDRPDSKTKKYYYRLKHVNTDGDVDLSETKILAINN